MLQVSTTTCRVSLYAPNGRQFQFLPPEVGTGLLRVETAKDLSQAVGSFSLTFDGRRDEDGRQWDERIPRRSLAFIHMARGAAGVSTNGTSPEADTTVMIGLTDLHAAQESYAQAAPRRQIQLRGRELSCVLLDAMLWYHPALATNPALGTMTLTDAKFGPFQASLITNPALVGAGVTPQDALRLILDHYLFGGGQAPIPSNGTHPEGMALPEVPVISLSLPDMPLSRLLDPNYGAWNTFLPGVVVPYSQTPMESGSLWNYLHLYIDRNFQEFFTRIEEGQCRMHFRGKPFLHKRVLSGTRFKSAGTTASTETEPTLTTIELDPGDILTQQLARDTTQVYNVFLVLPRAFSNSHQYANMRYLINPQVVDEPEHPSFVGRYGIRLMPVQSMYLAPVGAQASQEPTPTPAATPQPLKTLTAQQARWQATYAPLANQIAAQQGIPPALRPWFVASIEQESSFNPTAVGTSGEQGMAQLLPATATHLGVANPFDPVQALTGAAKYWNEMRAMPAIGDNPQLILAGYNAGPGSVVAAGGHVPPQAAAHVRNVTARVPTYAPYAGATTAVAPSGSTPPAGPAGGDPVIAHAEKWAAILLAWYDMGGELFSGTIVVRGSPAYNVGHRLVCTTRQGTWEAYIEGVNHSYDVRTGQYITTLRVTRGWPLSPTWTLSLVMDGETTITAASGGPPDVDPGEGPGLGPELEGR